MANGILVFIEHVDGKINRASYEAVRAAQLIGGQINQEVTAVVFGENVAVAVRCLQFEDIASQVAGHALRTLETLSSAMRELHERAGQEERGRAAVGGHHVRPVGQDEHEAPAGREPEPDH